MINLGLFGLAKQSTFFVVMTFCTSLLRKILTDRNEWESTYFLRFDKYNMNPARFWQLNCLLGGFLTESNCNSEKCSSLFLKTLYFPSFHDNFLLFPVIFPTIRHMWLWTRTPQIFLRAAWRKTHFPAHTHAGTH